MEALRRKKRMSALLLGCAVSIFFLHASRGAEAAEGAALFLSPTTGTLLVGSTFDVSVLLDTKGGAINTIEVELLFPPDKMQIASPSVGRSLVRLWPASPIFSNKEGRIYFVGGIPSPGMITSQGIVLTLTFRVVAPGEAVVRFGEKTSVLANDGRATDVLRQRPSSFYTFQIPAPQGPVITSPTHPDREKWYRDPNPLFIWQKTDFADGYSYEMDSNPSGFPDTISEGAQSSVSFQGIENGTRYFHLRERAGGVWGGVSHYLVNIDNDLPASFRANVSPALRTTNSDPILRFFTTDALSGLSHYELKVIPLSGDGGSEALFFEVTSPYQMTNLAQGRYQIIVRALDKAGNARDEAVTLDIVRWFNRFFTPEGVDLSFMFLSWRTLLIAVLVLLALLLIALKILWSRHRHHIARALKEDIASVAKRLRKKNPAAFLLVLLCSAFIAGAIPVLAQDNADLRDAYAPPRILVAPRDYYPLDEVLYLEGAGVPDAIIELLFEKAAGDAPAVRSEVASNRNGEWFFSERIDLKNGDWSMRARVKGNPDSDWSLPRLMRSVVTGFRIGSLTIRYALVALVAGCLLLLAMGLFLYSFFRVRLLERSVKTREMLEKNRSLERELHERGQQDARRLVEENFLYLRAKIVEELSHFETRVRKGTKLTEEEEAHMGKLIRELGEAEENIQKKLKEVT